MSVIFKCDRCKEVIDHSEMTMFMRYGVDELKQFEDLDTPITAYTAYTCLLCNECKDAFAHFLLNLKADIPQEG